MALEDAPTNVVSATRNRTGLWNTNPLEDNILFVFIHTPRFTLGFSRFG
jgi:hypothetical protein